MLQSASRPRRPPSSPVGQHLILSQHGLVLGGAIAFPAGVSEFMAVSHCQPGSGGGAVEGATCSARLVLVVDEHFYGGSR